MPQAYPNNDLSVVFRAVVQATEEAIVNAMVAADTVIGVAGFKVEAMPEDQSVFSQLNIPAR